MKRLALQAGAAVLVGLLASCGLGYAAAGTQVTTPMRDISIIFLAVFSLIGSLVLAAVSFVGAWAVERFGSKAVAGVRKAGRLVGRAEDVTQNVVEKATVRPVARTARVFTSGATFVRAALGGASRR